MDADLIAALERQSLRMLISSKQDGDDYERIRAHIDRLRNGGERAQIAALEAERDKLAGIVRGWHWLAVGPDEMGDYLHQRELIKASEPYADPALKAIARGAHQGGN